MKRLESIVFTSNIQEKIGKEREEYLPKKPAVTTEKKLTTKKKNLINKDLNK